MTFVEANVEAFWRVFDYRGRSTRPAFWWVFFTPLIAGVLVSALAYLAGHAPEVVFLEFYFFAELIYALPMLALGVRRLHDTNVTGWLILLLVVARIIGGLLYFLVGFMFLGLFAVQTTEEDNEYGPNPLIKTDEGKS
jgi:uncharacterized membrane protein YhaH (DUF805 family)